jgi:DNA mismatch repair protein MutL
MIRVIDDGCGMLHDDALLAFERHATSKLRTSDDLVSIATLGFRGEALPSMASVARLLLETRSAEEENGTSVEFAGGRLVGVKPAGLPVGTSVSVADLFYCVPARRQFLKSETTELGHIASLVTHYALAHPQKQFTLKTPSQEIVNTPPVETLAERFYQLFGKQALDEMIEMTPQAAPVRAAITESDLDEAGRAAELSVRGFISRPEVQRANRNGIYVFVNRRLVRDRLLLHAVHEAYRNVLPGGVFPVVLLFLDLPAIEVDVNVHPSKIEVRFRHPQFVHDFARDAIRLTLGQVRPVPSFAPPAIAAQSVAAVAAASSGVSHESGAMAAPSAVLPPLANNLSDHLDSTADSFGLSAPPLPPEAQRFQFEPRPSTPFAAAGLSENFRPDRFAPEQFAAAIGAAPAAQSIEFPASAASLADLKPLGQVNASFIVAVNGEGLWLIDQHVAHERVLFEQHVRARQQGGLTGQRLLTPIIAHLAPRQRVILDQIAEELAANGFDVTPMGQDSVAIQSTPAGVAAADAEQLLAEILCGIERERQAISIDSVQAKIAASTACHAAIKVNTPLDVPKMEWLLAQLADTDLPMSCPHGRPVLLRYSLWEIERAFKRV